MEAEKSSMVHYVDKFSGELGQIDEIDEIYEESVRKPAE